MRKPETKRFHSHGKLMLTGEYMVMFGAQALAIPVNLGQTLTVAEKEGDPVIHWQARQQGRPWFRAELSYRPWKILGTDHEHTAVKLLEMFQAGAELSPGRFTDSLQYEMATDLEFDRSWGLGSSSTLISNLSFWLGCDPFRLYRKVACGSGYDIAAARANRPILFRIVAGEQAWKEIAFSPSFLDCLFFVYQGNKQDSERGLEELLHRPQPTEDLVERISQCTEMAIRAEDIGSFEECLREHEALVAGFLGKTPVGKEKFPDFKGTVKSLGTWGGDFILASHGDDPGYVEDYFRGKNLHPIFRFDELILKTPQTESSRS